MKLLAVLLLGVYFAGISAQDQDQDQNLRGQGVEPPKKHSFAKRKFKEFLEATYEKHKPEKLKEITELLKYCRDKPS